MHLRHALGDAESVDPTRPLKLGSLTSGIEAAAEAASMLSEAAAPPPAFLAPRPFRKPVYWSVDHATRGHAELFGFPTGWHEELPTAIEVALVKAVAALPPDQHSIVFAGGVEIILGSESACHEFRKAAFAAENPMAGDATEFDGFNSAAIAPGDGRGLKVALDCLLSSYATSPLKFRFLELYRVMEALFLADVKNRLIASFDAQPAAALNEAAEALKSELRQVTALAEPHQDLFEECWRTLDTIKDDNRFSAALFRRLKERKSGGGEKWIVGAALVYQIRCAVVHAGEKDMIFENFVDGDIAIKAILPFIERAALQMLGIRLG